MTSDVCLLGESWLSRLFDVPGAVVFKSALTTDCEFIGDSLRNRFIRISGMEANTHFGGRTPISK
jgi:hypothetical protein